MTETTEQKARRLRDELAQAEAQAKKENDDAAQSVDKFIPPGADKVDGWGDTKLEDIDATSLNLSAAVWCAAREALGREPDGCGCVTFYTPKQWAARGEDYGRQSDLIIVHDGGDFAPLLNPVYERFELSDKFDEALRETLGQQILLEPCTGWYTSLTHKP